MLRKKHIILALVIVSVLLGSLLYNNIAQAGTSKYRIYKDSVKISLLSPREKGILLAGGWPEEFPFTFEPKGTLLNVTNMWITYVYSSHEKATEWLQFNITLNHKHVASVTYGVVYRPVQHGIQITDPNIYSALVEGINLIIIKDTGLTIDKAFYLYELTIFIEYKYKAR
jgi:hypothetical protein